MKPTPLSVIPTGVRPSVLGWSNGAEEPVVCLRRQIAVLIFLVTLLSPTVLAQELPKGWRRPTRAEASQRWRLRSKTKFLVVKADFDGDGQDDLAELLVSESGGKCALFVRLSSEHNTWREPIWHVESEGLGRFGIDVVRPGKHETLCSSDPSSCDPKTPATVDLRNHGIQFSSYGEASSLAYGDRRAGGFQWVPMSD